MAIHSVSVVVPVLHDTAALLRLVESIRGWSVQPLEVIVVDGGQEPAVRRLCEERGYLYLAAEPVRGTQLDLGARQARGETLWFLHADAVVATDALESIVQARESGYESGCFRFRFQGRSTLMKSIIEQLVRLRIALGGTAYSDQGLFAARKAYEGVRGIPHLPLFEEVRFIEGLRSRRTFVPLATPIGVATHRWERDGYVRRSLRNRMLAIAYRFGMPAGKLSRQYRNEKPAPVERHR